MKRRIISTAAFLAGATTLAVSLPPIGGGRVTGVTGHDNLQAVYGAGISISATEAQPTSVPVAGDRGILEQT